MKVAILTPKYHLHGGSERRTHELVKHLSREGVEVTVFANQFEEIAPRGVEVKRVPILKGAAWLKALSYAVAVRRMTTGKFDIIHSQARTLDDDVVTAGGGSHLAYLESLLAEIESPVERRKVERSLFHRTTLWLERKQYARCHALICNSEWSRQCFLQRGQISPEKTHVVHNGVDADAFSPRALAPIRKTVRRKLGFEDEDIVVAHVGAGFQRKGVPTLIHAVAQAARHDPRLRLAVIGSGNTTPLEELATSLDILDACRFPGPMEALEAYSCADIFALLTTFDPFANSTMEALACGLPVVTTTSNGVHEILQRGVQGLIVDDARDVGQAADHLLALCDPSLRQSIGSVGRELVADAFTWRKTGEKTMDIYQQVLESR